MDFEWDDAKNRANISKHGVDFRDAVHVFEDPCPMVREDRGDYGEQRFQLIGRARPGVLFVVYTERASDVIRIISARKATKRERTLYLEGTVG